MKIIKRGQIPENKTIRVKCNFCETEFEFQAKEAELVYDQREGDAYKIGCPVCGRAVWIAK